MSGTRVTRRRLLGGGAAVLGGATLGGLAVAASAQQADAGEQPWGGDTLPFRGAHQSGIETPPQAHAWFVALDLVADADREALGRLLALWTDDIERLTTGRGAVADQERELAGVPARLTVTVGLGASLFDRLGLVGLRPPSLRPLPALVNDRLEALWGEADLMLQVGADDLLTVSHAVRVLTRDVRTIAEVRWTQRGFARARGAVAGRETPRNLLGQVDGTANPVPGSEDFARVVWAGDGPRWWRGGTMLVVRRMRMDLDAWERLGRADRELVVGRRLGDGSPLTGGVERDKVDLSAVDADGLPVVPEAAHVRVARPQAPDERFLRRGYSYDDTAEPGGGRRADLRRRHGRRGPAVPPRRPAYSGGRPAQYLGHPRGLSGRRRAARVRVGRAAGGRAARVITRGRHSWAAPSSPTRPTTYPRACAALVARLPCADAGTGESDGGFVRSLPRPRSQGSGSLEVHDGHDRARLHEA